LKDGLWTAYVQLRPPFLRIPRPPPPISFLLRLSNKADQMV
jgi:hypothetical protein